MTINFNSIINTDCLQFMRNLSDNCIDLIITSPPYAEQRKNSYGGISPDYFPLWMGGMVGREIFRILKPTGAFVLNIKEHASNGRRDPYVLKTVLNLSEIFIWNDTYIWNKPNPFPTGNKRRLKDGFEYCYLFVKSKDYKFYPDQVLIPSNSKYLESEKRRSNKGIHKVTNGSGLDMGRRYVNDMVRPSNVLTLPSDTTNHKHPATFPIGLPSFFIKLLTEKNDVVYDPFVGSGTTCLAAKQLNRKYLGTDINSEYVKLAQNRLI